MRITDWGVKIFGYVSFFFFFFSLINYGPGFNSLRDNDGRDGLIEREFSDNIASVS